MGCALEQRGRFVKRSFMNTQARNAQPSGRLLKEKRKTQGNGETQRPGEKPRGSAPLVAPGHHTQKACCGRAASPMYPLPESVPGVAMPRLPLVRPSGRLAQPA